MARVYSQRFMAVNGAVTATATVPDGYLWVLRDWIAWNSGDGDGELEHYTLECTTTGVVYAAGDVPSGAPFGTASWQGRQVVNAGETIEWGTTTDTWTFALSGYALELP